MKLNTEQMSALAETLALLGGILLKGTDGGLFDELREEPIVAELAALLIGPLGDALNALQNALNHEETSLLVEEYARLFVVPAGGAWGHVIVPPWEDCWTGRERRVMGERSHAAMRAYAAAGVGFEAMGEKPADHVGLELCFIATLLNEELDGARDGAARRAFGREHLEHFLPQIGKALSQASTSEFWKSFGSALEALPAVLGQVDVVSLPLVRE